MSLRTTNIAKTSRLSQVLDHGRWVAAATVMFGHVRNTLFMGYTEVEEMGLVTKIFYLVTNLQNEAVICFFVISGVVVGGKCLNILQDDSLLLGRYAVDRLIRLYIVLVPAVVLSVALIWLQNVLIEAPKFWCAKIDYLDILGNFFYIQHVLVDQPCNNIPLWSLANEFWYYLLFPALFVAWVRRGRRDGWVAGSLVLVVLIFLAFADVHDRHGVLVYFSIWALGVLVWVPLQIRPNIVVSLALLVIALALSRSHVLDGLYYIRDSAIAGSLLLVFLSVLAWDDLSGPLEATSKTSLVTKTGVFLAGFSYSLYLVHWPILHFGRNTLKHIFNVSLPLNPGVASSYGIYAIITSVCVMTALLFWWLFESRTLRFRRWAYRMLNI